MARAPKPGGKNLPDKGKSQGRAAIESRATHKRFLTSLDFIVNKQVKVTCDKTMKPLLTRQETALRNAKKLLELPHGFTYHCVTPFNRSAGSNSGPILTPPIRAATP